MTCQEMATLMHHRLKLTIIIVNNERYGTIRAHQEREFPHRQSGTDLTIRIFAPSHVLLAQQAIGVENLGQFKSALSQCQNNRGVSFIEIKADPQFLAPGVLAPKILTSGKRL